MAIKNYDQLKAILADNSTGNISPADIRSMLEGVWEAYGQMTLQAPLSILAVTTTPALVTNYDTVSLPTGQITANPTTGLMTVPTGGEGVYRVGFAIGGNPGGPADMIIRGVLNGTPVGAGLNWSVENNNRDSRDFSVLFQFAAGDEVGFQIATETGSVSIDLDICGIGLARIGGV